MIVRIANKKTITASRLLLHVDVDVLFTKDNFQANETVMTLPILVSKTARIASQIELVIVPLTVQEAIEPHIFPFLQISLRIIFVPHPLQVE